MIKENINKIDFELKNLFDSVTITEKTKKGEFLFEINASKVLEVDGLDKKVEVKLEIAKPSLNSNTVKWSYYTNPLKETSEKIEIVSDIDTISSDIYKIVSKKRMTIEYFESLSPFIGDVELIVENDQYRSLDKLDNQRLVDILERFGITDEVVNESKYVDGVTETRLVFRKSMKPQDRYMLDLNFKSIGLENVQYEDDNIIIDL